MVYFTFIRTPHTFKWIMAAISLLFYFLIIFGFIGKQATLQNPRTFFAVDIMFGSYIRGTFNDCFNDCCWQTESFGYEIWTTDEGNRYQSHFAFLAGLFVYFWLLDRQNEYIHLLDFQVNRTPWYKWVSISRYI